VVNAEFEATLKQRFRQQEQHLARQAEEAEERTLILEYEQYRQQLASRLFEELPDRTREALRKDKAEALRQSDRFEKIRPEARESEVDVLVLQEIARDQAPPFEKWLVRRKVQQTVLPFLSEN
jgi:hypothetical protein